ncbi:MAG TPA: hypothetical protein VMM57_09130 [Bacteroidota bacterium]|nr:hypothetical protein [Bacteroidota bacterium]
MAQHTKELKIFADTQKEFLRFLKSKFKIIHLSNIFFRDIHYGVMSYLKLQNMKLSYLESERVSRGVVEMFEEAGIFKRIDDRTWLVNYPEFKLPPAKPAVAARPAPKPAASPVPAHAAAPAARPATPQAGAAVAEAPKNQP